MVELQTASQLYDRILEGRIGRGQKTYMKLPTKRRHISPMIPNIPIMEEWVRQIQIAVEELSEIQQKAIFEQYFGELWGRMVPSQWAKKLGISQQAFRKRISRAYREIDKRVFAGAEKALTGRHNFR